MQVNNPRGRNRPQVDFLLLPRDDKSQHTVAFSWRIAAQASLCWQLLYWTVLWW